jgi:hypothetical protein
MNEDAEKENAGDRNHQGWNLKALRDNVERLHGGDQANLTSKCCQSIVKRLGYMKYHYQEAGRLVNSSLKEASSNDVLMKFILPNSDLESEQFDERRFHAEAHLIALMQSGHAILDTLGHVIYFAMKFDDLKPSQVAFHSVHPLLPAGPLKDLCLKLLDDPELKHLAALVNVSKHRSVVEPSISVSFVEDELPHGLKFQGFDYKGSWYPVRWAVPFAIKVFDRLQHHVFGVGRSLEDHLALNAAPTSRFHLHYP